MTIGVAVTDPEVLFEPDDLQRALFAVLFDVFSRTGRWPLFRYVNQTLRQTRGVDAQAVLESLPMIGVSPFGGGIYGASWALTAGGAVQPDSSVGLTLVGLHLAGWDQGVGGCLAVVRRLAALLGAWTPDPFASEDPVARWSDGHCCVGVAGRVRLAW